jgi:hypothetical protein
MTSKLVLDRQRATEALVAAAEAHRATIDEGLDALRAKKQKDADVGAVVALLAGITQARLDELAKTDQALVDELEDDAPIRKARDEASEQLRVELLEIRESITGRRGRCSSTRGRVSRRHSDRSDGDGGARARARRRGALCQNIRATCECCARRGQVGEGARRARGSRRERDEAPRTRGARARESGRSP